MTFSEGLSDTGEITERGSPVVRGGITGAGTFLGGVLHTLPFLIPTYLTAITVGTVVVGFELVMLAYLRHRFFMTGFGRSLAFVTLGGVIIVLVSVLLGSLAA
jgi:erythrin-vacuolar iron transport family protein